MLTPETAMLTGRVLRTGVVLFVTSAEFVVDVDIALPGRDVDKLFGVISPERKPKVIHLSVELKQFSVKVSKAVFVKRSVRN
jgi:hypothetical protein